MKLSGPKIQGDSQGRRQNRYHLIGCHHGNHGADNSLYPFNDANPPGNAEFPIIDHPFGGKFIRNVASRGQS